MNGTTLHTIGRSLAAAAVAALLAACDVTTVGPAGESAPRLDVAAAADEVDAARTIDLGSCSDLQAPEGSRLAAHVYANGVQIYQWNGTGWAFVGPSAVLTADAAGAGVVGTHYLTSGPTWRSASGSTVVARLPAAKRCPAPAPNAIPWLGLDVASAEGPGIFEGTTYIQRVNTTGGVAPSYPGSAGQVVEVPYTAEYYFFRAQ